MKKLKNLKNQSQCAFSFGGGALSLASRALRACDVVKLFSQEAERIFEGNTLSRIAKIRSRSLSNSTLSQGERKFVNPLSWERGRGEGNASFVQQTVTDLPSYRPNVLTTFKDLAIADLASLVRNDVKPLVPQYLSALVPSKKVAFTLAEVLITLGVIGVVAAITMPTLIQNHKKTVTVNRLKKTYSELSQAFRMAEVKHGEVRNWAEWNDAEVILDKYIIPELKGVKKYGKAKSERYPLCFDSTNKSHNSGTNLASQYIWMNNGWFIDNPFFIRITSSILLPNGVCVGLNPNTRVGNNQYYVFIDVNNTQRPNIAGEDLFFFRIDEKNRLMPWGYELGLEKVSNPSVPSSCDKKTSKNNSPGGYCAARIMLEGWQMKY